MKVIVIIKFKDKYSKIWHNVNDELIVSKERYEEIKNFVKVIENKSATKLKNKSLHKKVNLK